MCVYRTEDGQNPGATTLKMVHGALLGEYTMHSFGESPKEENVSLLSQILEDSAHPKYSLSARACQGILNRAERRGKELPAELKEALIEQSLAHSIPTTSKEQKSETESSGTLLLKQSQSMTKQPDIGVAEPGGMMTEAETASESELDSPPQQFPQANGTESLASKNEPENQGGARESSFSMNTPEPCQPLIINPYLRGQSLIRSRLPERK